MCIVVELLHPIIVSKLQRSEEGGTRGREACGLHCPGVVFILGIMHYGTVATEKKENHQKRLVTRRVVGGVTKELPTANELTVV